MKRTLTICLVLLVIALLFLSACVTKPVTELVSTQASIKTLTPTPIPTSTITPTLTVTPVATPTPINMDNYDKFFVLIDAEPFFPEKFLIHKPDEAEPYWIFSWLENKYTIECGKQVSDNQITFNVNGIAKVSTGSGNLVKLFLMKNYSEDFLTDRQLIIQFSPDTCQILVDESQENSIDIKTSNITPRGSINLIVEESRVFEEPLKKNFIKDNGPLWCYEPGVITMGINFNNKIVSNWNKNQDPPTACPSVEITYLAVD